MSTAIEYGLANPWQAQDLIEYALMNHSHAQGHVEYETMPAPASGDGQLAGVFVVPLVLVAVVVAVRRRLARRSG